MVRALTDQLAERPIADQEELTPQEISYLVQSKTFTPETFEPTSTRVARGASRRLRRASSDEPASEHAGSRDVHLLEHERCFSLRGRRSRRIARGWCLPVEAVSVVAVQSVLAGESRAAPERDHRPFEDKGWVSVSALMAPPLAGRLRGLASSCKKIRRRLNPIPLVDVTRRSEISSYEERAQAKLLAVGRVAEPEVRRNARDVGC